MIFHYSSREDLPKINEFLVQCDGPRTVKITLPKRSKTMNDYWHGFIDEIAKYMGETTEGAKAVIKESITRAGLLKMVDHKTSKNGLEYRVYRSSADLDKQEFRILFEYTMKVCDQLGIVYKYDPVLFAKIIF